MGELPTETRIPKEIQRTIAAYGIMKSIGFFTIQQLRTELVEHGAMTQTEATRFGAGHIRELAALAQELDNSVMLLQEGREWALAIRNTDRHLPGEAELLQELLHRRETSPKPPRAPGGACATAKATGSTAKRRASSTSASIWEETPNILSAEDERNLELREAIFTANRGLPIHRRDLRQELGRRLGVDQATAEEVMAALATEQLIAAQHRGKEVFYIDSRPTTSLSRGAAMQLRARRAAGPGVIDSGLDKFEVAASQRILEVIAGCPGCPNDVLVDACVTDDFGPTPVRQVLARLRARGIIASKSNPDRQKGYYFANRSVQRSWFRGRATFEAELQSPMRQE